MRILLTADPFIPVPPVGYGGIERIVASLAGELRTRGHSVGLVAKAGSTCAADRLFAWPEPKRIGPLNHLRNALALRAAVGEFQPQIVHSFSRLASLLPLLPTRLPKIMSYQRQTGPTPIRRALRMARRGTLRFTGCSEFICRQGRPGGGDWRAVFNFVDPAAIDFVPRVPADAPLLFLSRIESIKGPDLAIAVARQAGRRLIIAGNRSATGPEAAFFEGKIAPHLGRDGIEFVGEVADGPKNLLLGKAHALLVPIQWDEPFGIVFAEALAAGTPIISCARGALPEIVQPGKTGVFMTDLASGVEAVARAGALDRAACRADAEARFSLGACTSQYERLYAEGVRSQGSGVSRS
jgi:glycosyltransferase involved in cell wall biosynthesis